MTCSKCECLERVPCPDKKVFFRCGYPGEMRGRVVAKVPEWCTAAQIWKAPAWCGYEKGEASGKDDEEREAGQNADDQRDA